MTLEFLDYFVYAPHDFLETYEVRMKGGEKLTIGHYAIDFRRVCRVECPGITYPQKPNAEAMSLSKRLELSIETRTELGTKLAGHFSRAAGEDEIGV